MKCLPTGDRFDGLEPHKLFFAVFGNFCQLSHCKGVLCCKHCLSVVNVADRHAGDILFTVYLFVCPHFLSRISLVWVDAGQ